MSNSLNTMSTCDEAMYADALAWMDNLIYSVCGDEVQADSHDSLAVEIDELCIQRRGQDSSLLTDRQISDKLVEILWRERRQCQFAGSTEDDILQVHMYIAVGLRCLSVEERNRTLHSAHPEQDRLLCQLLGS